MKSCITVSLVPEARGGPFVLWDDLAAACRTAAEYGFDAIELFPPSADAIDRNFLTALLREHHLHLAAVGTGAGWVCQRLTLTDGEAERRKQARQFVRRIIDFAGSFGASAIIGSMQGRWNEHVQQPQAIEYLRGALQELGTAAERHGVPLIYEPLNRYETNLCNSLASGIRLLEGVPADQVVLLADLFHMNIEESNLAQAIRDAGHRIGHVHFVDSNRQAAGAGHLDFGPIAGALQDIGYAGYLSAEALPLPDSQTAARQTIEAFHQDFRPRAA